MERLEYGTRSVSELSSFAIGLDWAVAGYKLNATQQRPWKTICEQFQMKIVQVSLLRKMKWKYLLGWKARMIIVIELQNSHGQIFGNA